MKQFLMSECIRLAEDVKENRWPRTAPLWYGAGPHSLNNEAD